jgi:hypothetical protein
MEKLLFDLPTSTFVACLLIPISLIGLGVGIKNDQKILTVFSGLLFAINMFAFL